MHSSPASPARPLRVAIIGGGIGGLAAAHAFLRIGATVRVFERAPAIREVGAGLGVWTNAVRVLEAFGLGDRLRAVAQPVSSAGIFAADGRPLSVNDVSALTAELGAPSYVMHRADLQALLLAGLPKDVVVTDAACQGFREAHGGVIVDFAHAHSFVADLVIGADGFNSVIRHALWGDTPVRYSGQVCYRGVVPIQVARPGLLAEIQGRGIRMGHCPISASRMYWWACCNAARHEPEDAPGLKARLLELFRHFPLQMPDAIAATAPEMILHNELCDRPPLTRWSSGRVTLLGDAAHPMLPNLGQGACTAIEDAAFLARAVAQSPDLPAALAAYEAGRIPRTTRMVNLSWRFGHLVRWTNPLAVTLRESLFRLTPASAMQREFRRQLDYDAGARELAPDSVLTSGTAAA
ncbi:MAG TPA: FAD-dependent monooxygenase [Opitutus sp.]|nr:FAD-dependent monooxygenase [Opitutus sp.]